MDSMNEELSRLAEPFPAEDIEWRVSRAGMGKKGIFCMVIAYITARAIQKRLDDVVGSRYWRNEEPRMIEVNGKSAFVGGISLTFTDLGWVTKWDVSDPTNIEPAKGGFSGAMKRAGAQWGIGRYLYYLDETFAEVSDTDPGVRGWKWAKLSDKQGGATYYWKPPTLPAWALPKEPEHEVSEERLNDLKKSWKITMAPDSTNPAELREGFNRFVVSTVGEFPHSDHTCWTSDAWTKCMNRLAGTTEATGVSAGVPFEE